MMRLDGATVTCPNCNQPFPAQLDPIIDVGRDPSAKVRFLNGDIHNLTCQQCGFRFSIATPLLYHDPANELLLVHVPVELNLQQADRERLIGDLLNNLMKHIPNEQRRGYMLQPTTALTIQGMIEQILSADGFTPEMLEAQRNAMRLIQTILQTEDDALPALVEEHDAEINIQTFEIMAGIAEDALQEGRQNVAQHVLSVRDRLIELSTAGQEVVEIVAAQEQAVAEVIEALEGLGETPTLEDFVELIVSFADDDDQIQAVVGLQRPAFGYEFFQELTKHIDRAGGEEKQKLETMRDRILELAEMLDQQRRVVLEAAVGLLREILGSPDMEAAIQHNLHRIDDSFLAVLSANIQSAEENNDSTALAQLKQIFDIVSQIIRQNAPPELVFINDLLSAESLDGARDLLKDQASSMGPGLLELMDRVAADLLGRGDQETAQQLIAFREEAAVMMN